MANDTLNQTIQQLKAARSILVLAESGSNLDAVAASLALKEFLEKQEKQARVLSPTPLNSKLLFLPNTDQIQPASELAKNLVVELSLAKHELSELTYQKQDDKLSIFLTPKDGEFEPTDVTVKNAVYPFDLIVTAGIPSLENLGQFYERHSSMFYEIPVINIDFKPSNENFGKINLVELTFSAVSEIVFDLLSAYEPNFIDEKIATLLLAGLVSETNSFQNKNTSPQVFLKASKLVSLGARQQEIVAQLYRSKSLGLLRLWGRVLARLKQDLGHKLVYSVVNAQDVEKSEALSSDVDEIVFEMMQQLNFAKTFAFLAEGSGKTTVYVASRLSINFTTLFASYNPAPLGSGTFKFDVSKLLNEAETEVIATLEKELDKFNA
jgi:nanoRNase/pAp phosphatase (c-di-AMP/oligoRNAs hydrolase)